MRLGDMTLIGSELISFKLLFSERPNEAKLNKSVTNKLVGLTVCIKAQSKDK